MKNRPAITPGVYACSLCNTEGCSYCQGTGTVVYLSDREDLDAPILRWLTENSERNWNPRVIVQGR